MNAPQFWQKYFMKNHVPFIASLLGRGESSIYKWDHADGGKAAGGWNPLDILLVIMRGTKDLAPLRWLCRQFGGVFVPYLESRKAIRDNLPEILMQMRILNAKLVLVVNESALKKNISDEDAKAIRSCFDEYISSMESFVRRCEHGNYQKVT